MIFLPKVAERIQAPVVALPDQAENRGKIVRENDKTKPTAIDRPCDLEDFLFLFYDDLGAVWGVCWKFVWVAPRSTLIDLQEFLGDVLDGG